MTGAADSPLEADAPLTAADFAEAFGRVDRGCLAAPWLLAVSGGPDSTALMHAAAAWAGNAGRPLPAVATVDHRLRDGSRREADQVGSDARRLGLEHRVLTWDRPAGARASQDAARAARYRLLAAHAHELRAAAIVTAHTQDDQAETLLIRMADGSGPAGLAGMAAETWRHGAILLRPFLALPKARLVATCRARGWRFVEDPSNADDRFARVRWRTLIPALAAEGLDARRLARLAQRMRRVEAALEAAAAAAAARTLWRRADGAIVLDLGALAAEPDEIALRVLTGAMRATLPFWFRPGGRKPDDGAPRLSQRERACPLTRSHIRLDRAEAALAALLSATRAGRPLRRTLAGCLLTLDASGQLAVTPEPERKRGRAVTLTAATVPHSLGIRQGCA